MVVDPDSREWPPDLAAWIAGRRLAIGSSLESMSRRAAAETLRRYGATVVELQDEAIDGVLIGDAEVPSVRPGVAIIRETELWQRLGLVEGADLRRLYTPAMLAELVGTTVAAIRRWHRQGTLIAVHCVRRLPYFDFTETAVARKLTELAGAGCSLSMIDRRLAKLAARLPDVPRPLADPRVVVDGRRLYLRQGDDLTEPGGQLLLDFDAGDDAADEPAVLSFELDDLSAGDSSCSADDGPMFTSLRDEALAYEEGGDLQAAIDIYRSILAAGGPTADLHFALGDVLYRQGDLSAARERFYAALELDEQFVEARLNLGCILAETGELELAEAALVGTLRFHRDYADAHYHLARVLDQLGRGEEAIGHYEQFVALSPESAWAAAARARLNDQSSDVSPTVAGGG